MIWAFRTTSRGGIYQYVRRIPGDLRDTFSFLRVQKSLGTRDQRQAHAAALDLDRLWDERFNEARIRKGLDIAPTGTATVTTHNWAWSHWEDLAAWFGASLAGEDWRVCLGGVKGQALGTKPDLAHLPWRVDSIVTEHIARGIKLLDISVADYAGDWFPFVQSYVRRMSKTEPEFERFMAACLKAELDYLDVFQLREARRGGLDHPHPDSIQGRWRPLRVVQHIATSMAAAPAVSPLATTSLAGKTLTSCRAKWIENRKKAKKNVRAAYLRDASARRRGLERQVYCLDPFCVVDGRDRWNPIGLIDVNDIAYLQRLARALLPAPGANEQHYFRDASVNPIVAAFLAAKREGHATPRRVAEFLAQPRLFESALAGATDIPSLETLALLQGDEKTSAPILSTARQVFQWCADDRMARLTTENTVSLDEVCKGRADLFVAVPTENLEQVAPFLRWLLNDLFTAIRRNKPRQRVMIFIDEAGTLGRFEEIVTAYGELPGYNGSLWTFSQSRAQITSLYGPDDARTLIGNAKVVSFSDPSPADPDETELWLQALGEYTIEEETKTITEGMHDNPGSTSIGKTLKGVRLMSPDAVTMLAAADLLVIVNSQSYTKRPLHIRKTHYLDERLTPYVKDLGATVASV